MPHAIYLHSGLTQARGAGTQRRGARAAVRFSNREVVVGTRGRRAGQHGHGDHGGGAFHAGHSDVAEIESAYHTLTPAPRRRRRPRVFLVSLMASGISSFGGRHDGRPDDHAGLRRLPDPDLGAAAGHHGAGLRRRGARDQPDQGAGPQPGRALPSRCRSRRSRSSSSRATAPSWGVRQQPADDLAAIAATIAILVLNAVLLLQTFGVPLPGLASG